MTTANNTTDINNNQKSLAETILLESFDSESGIGLMLSEYNNGQEFELHVFEGSTGKSMTMKISNTDMPRLFDFLVPYFSDEFNE